jgi:glycosyltransferase involved in cell wall biosynthesis
MGKKTAIINHKYDSDKLLTVVIPTYNREERLINELRTIFSQPEYKNVEIVILDNHSDYDITNSLKRNFTEEELSSVELVRNPINIGMYGNISNSFMFCKTKYMWLLSDDDETLRDSIKTVLSDIENNMDIAVFKYSINNFLPEEDKIISNISEFINYYRSGSHTSGTMIFISNNIFNMELLEPFIQGAFTLFGPFMLIIAALSTNTIRFKFCPESIVSYIPPAPGSEWNFLSSLVVASTLEKFLMSIFYKDNYAITKRQIIELGTLYIRDFSRTKLIIDLFKINSRWKRGYIYNKLFFDMMIHDTKHHWAFFFLFHFLNLINIDYAGLSKIKQKTKNIIKRFRPKKIVENH